MMATNYPTFSEYMHNRLLDPEEALAYLEVSLQEYLEDPDDAALLSAMRRVAVAQNQPVPSLDAENAAEQFHGAPLQAVLAALHQLGFRVRLDRESSGTG